MSTATDRAERVLAAADGMRRRMIVPVARVAPRLFVSREARIAVVGSVLVLSAFVVSGVAPAWALALGPLVWGVPHVLADIRYLVVRPGMHRRLLVAIPIALGIALAAAIGLRGAIVGAAAATLLSRASVARKAVLVAILGVLFAAAGAGGHLSDVVFAHLHNLAALAFYCAWRPRRSSRLWTMPVAVFAAGVVLVLAGAFDGLAFGTRLGSFDVELARRVLAPGASPILGARLVVLFAFAQAVHYVVWLGFVPAESRRRETPPSIRQGAREVIADLGPWLLAVAALFATVFVAWAVFDVAKARDGYIVAASFHGWLEIGAAVLLIAERRRPVMRAGDGG